jgi:hypothetical protein
MLLMIVCLLVRRVPGLAALVFRRDLAKDAELLVVRHENTALRRHAGRIRYRPADRVWFTVLAADAPRALGRSLSRDPGPQDGSIGQNRRQDSGTLQVK